LLAGVMRNMRVVMALSTVSSLPSDRHPTMEAMLFGLELMYSLLRLSVMLKQCWMNEGKSKVHL